MFTILRTLKIKDSNALIASENHCTRKVEVAHADPNGLHYEFNPHYGTYHFTSNTDYSSLNSLYEEVKKGPKLSLQERLNKLESNYKIQTPRKDSVKVIEVMIAAPGGLFDHIPRHELKNNKQFQDWCEGNFRFVKNYFTDERPFARENPVLSTYVHLDETTPHLHFHVVPLQTKEGLKGRTFQYNAKHYLGGAAKMSQLQDKYHRYMCGWMPEIKWVRGQKQSGDSEKVRHQTVKDWYKKIDRIHELGIHDKVQAMILDELQERKKQAEEARKALKELNQYAKEIKSPQSEDLGQKKEPADPAQKNRNKHVPS